MVHHLYIKNMINHEVTPSPLYIQTDMTLTTQTACPQSFGSQHAAKYNVHGQIFRIFEPPKNINCLHPTPLKKQTHQLQIAGSLLHPQKTKSISDKVAGQNYLNTELPVALYVTTLYRRTKKFIPRVEMLTSLSQSIVYKDIN